MRPLPGISVVLPAHNEAGNVSAAIEAARRAGEQVADKVEIIVVDDGSSDGTADEARRAGADVVSHPVNRGYGAALRSGFDAATQPWVFLMDADNQFDAGQLADLAAHAADADLIAGYRVDRADESRRVWAGRAWNVLCRVTFGYLGRDIDCAFKLIRTDLLRSAVLNSDGASISAELFLWARRTGARIVEVPVEHFPRTHGTPSGMKPAVVARAFRELWLLRRRMAQNVRGLRTTRVEFDE